MAVTPFRGKLSIDPPGSAHADKKNQARLQISGRCRPPILSAWRSAHSYEKLALWAVTEGTDKFGYEAANGLGRRCAPAARRRLGLGGLAIMAGVITFGVQRRRPGTAIVTGRGSNG